MHDVAVLDDVLLALHAQLAGVLATSLAAQLDDLRGVMEASRRALGFCNSRSSCAAALCTLVISFIIWPPRERIPAFYSKTSRNARKSYPFRAKRTAFIFSRSLLTGLMLSRPFKPPDNNKSEIVIAVTISQVRKG